MSSPIDDMITITDAVFQADLAKLHQINAEELRLHDEIDALHEEVLRSEAEGIESAMALQQLGGDLLWKAWVGRKRQLLNLQLANVRARKLDALDALKKSFGKNSVAHDLGARMRMELDGQTALRMLTDEQTQMVLHRTAALRSERH